MIKRKIIIGIVVLILLSVFFSSDRQLFYYGKSRLKFYKLLPLNINPDFQSDWEGGFALRDEYGFSLVNKGSRYSNSSTIVSRIIEYGFNKDSLIVLVEDSIGEKYLVECRRYNSKASEKKLIKIHKRDNTTNQKSYKWIKITNQKFISKLEYTRNFSVLGIVIILLTSFFTLFKKHRK